MFSNAKIDKNKMAVIVAYFWYLLGGSALEENNARNEYKII